MQTFYCCLLLLSSVWAMGQPARETPAQSLNQYVAFLSRSADELASRFRMIEPYAAAVRRYRKTPGALLRVPSSGPLETYYYKKALTGNGLTAAEKQRLSHLTDALWQLLTKIDQTGKALETYVRLTDYQLDSLHRSDKLLDQLQTLFGQFNRDEKFLYGQIQQVYRRYQPYAGTNGYLYTERKMEQVLLSQQQLTDTLAFYLDDDGPSPWPLNRIQQSILADEKWLADFGAQAVAYPASAMVSRFKAALRSTQILKRRAVDDYTFAARQSARHDNVFYNALLEEYNQDLLASYEAFVNYSAPVRQLLQAPRLSPVFALAPPQPAVPQAGQTVPFRDRAPLAFTLQPAASPVSAATFGVLNGYVAFINESLRQMHTLQVLLRNYQASAEDYRDPDRASQRASLTYAHDAYKVPVSDYQLLLNASRQLPLPYRASITGQAEVLRNLLTEMDSLSIELIAYTTEKQYLRDRLQRSDAILDRYAYLFDRFDQKKERFYQDLRRIHESYPVADPASAWLVSGRAMLKTIDGDRAVLLGIKAYLNGETDRLPATDKVVADARTLIANEYQNLRGLPRYGRNNGLCPYSPYEDVGENSLRFAGMVPKLKSRPSTENPYESVYYFYNNELIYQYNRFSDLAKSGVLQAINQPDVFLFRVSRSLPNPSAARPPAPPARPAGLSDAAATTPMPAPEDRRIALPTTRPATRPDTVYVDHTRVDTVYVDRTSSSAGSNSLNGFAANNMVLLLDVSSSMNSPYKMPLLKQAVNSLLTQLRPEDQVSIVVYSGKARVALKPTSGANTSEIARVINDLQSDGDTDGNEGIRLAYKLANKHYIRAGNNRIILATDGEFSVSNEVQTLIGENTRQDVYLTVFTFGRAEVNGPVLRRIALAGKGNYIHITRENASRQLIAEAQAGKMR